MIYLSHRKERPEWSCHSEGAKRLKNLDQGRLSEGEESFASLRMGLDPSLRLRVTK